MPEPDHKTDGQLRRDRGLLVAVVGPSGVGKDSLIDYARDRFAGDDRFIFMRRAITRPAEAGGENHIAMTDDAFAAAEREGSFAISWKAHNLSYGVPVEARSYVSDGACVVVNASRGTLQELKQVFGRLLVVSVTADADVIATRLHARGREDQKAIRVRLNRSAIPWPADCNVVNVDNSGALPHAGERLVGILRKGFDI